MRYKKTQKERCMAMKMNKSKFIKVLSEETGYNEQKSILVNDVLESHFILGRNNEERIIQNLEEKVCLNEDEAKNVYEISMKIISSEIRNKVRHPFKSKD